MEFDLPTQANSSVRPGAAHHENTDNVFKQHKKNFFSSSSRPSEASKFYEKHFVVQSELANSAMEKRSVQYFEHA